MRATDRGGAYEGMVKDECAPPCASDQKRRQQRRDHPKRPQAEMHNRAEAGATVSAENVTRELGADAYTWLRIHEPP